MSLRLASLVSGGGTTMQSAIGAMQYGNDQGIHSSIPDTTRQLIEGVGGISGIDPVLVVGTRESNGSGKGLDRARSLGIQTEYLDRSVEKDPIAIITLLAKHRVDVIIQNGHLPLMPMEIVRIYSGNFMDPRSYKTPEEYKQFRKFFDSLSPDIQQWAHDGDGKRYIFNQHPGPVRSDHNDFGGPGMFSARPTAARILYLLAIGATREQVFTESTVQYTHPELDKGVLLGMRRLDFGSELEEFRRACDTEPIGRSILLLDVQEKVKEFTEKVQAQLLPLEHQNVIELLQKVGRGDRLQEHPVYRESLVPEANLPILSWAKLQAGVLFPKG